ncbi:MAG: hypothetical protein WAU41_03790 [Gaiellaceae bacterium]
MSMRGRPGTKALPLMGGGRAVGGPIALGLLAAFFAFALVGFAATAVVLLLAAPDLAARDPLALRPVLAVHLLALGFLPFAVTGASFHLLPVMLRNDVRHPRALRLALLSLLGGFLVAPGIAWALPGLLWPGAALLATGLGIVVTELLGLVRHAPTGRPLVASRVGVTLSCLNVVVALALGALVFSRGDDRVAGVTHVRWLLVHLHVAVLGWLVMLIVTVGRTLGPMLAAAPTAPNRRRPLTELALALGTWTLVTGIAISSNAVALTGGVVIVATLASFARIMIRVARGRRIPIEAPLAHLLAGVLFLAQAAVLGGAMLLGFVSPQRAIVAYVVFLMLGWAGGVTLGHLGKLLSLSLWVWWPPGPRPKQDALYPRKVWLIEAIIFAVGVELLAVGSLAGSVDIVRVGGLLVACAAALAAVGSGTTWLRRASPGAFVCER